MHASIEAAFRAFDPWGERFVTEVEVSAGGVTGHVDLYDIAEETVWDWKTTSRRKAEEVFPSRSQVLQVQMYGALLSASGRPVKRVGLIAVTRDGTEEDWVEWSTDFDPDLADEGFRALHAIESAEVAPAPARDAVSFCRSYCVFYGACPGRESGSSAVLDEDGVAAGLAYLSAKRDADDAKARMEAARSALEGRAGEGGGVRVSWSSRSSSVVDRAAVEAALGEVPMRQGRESLALTVKAVP